MPYSYEKDSYLQELKTEVISCTPCLKEDGTISDYEVVLKDTILFPEGGGQPSDEGTIDGVPVISVNKKDGKVVHHLKSPPIVGKVVEISLYWPKRLEHMQQHSAQHLISAMAESVFNFCTTSWNMGVDESCIELNCPNINVYQVTQLENMVNEIIRDSAPVTVRFYDVGDPELSKVSKRLDLPKDHDGPIRVVSIGMLDNNPCCGTHVKNASHLQAIKLLYTEKGKKNKTNLYFVAGERLMRRTRQCVSQERQLCQVLNCCPEEQVIHVETLQKSLKLSSKTLQSALRDVAELEARLFNGNETPPKYFSLHRKNAELDFINIFLSVATSEDTLFFLTVGDSKSGGHMVLSGPKELVETYGPQVCEILEGKGVFTNGRFQAKVKRLSFIPEAENLLKSINRS